MNKPFKDALFHQNDGFYENIKAHSENEKEARFNVYRNNVFVSLMDALADIFPVTQTLVGEDFFRAMARIYIQQHPPKTPIISDYGDVFAHFVRHFKPAQNLPFLGDLAELECKLLALTNAQEYKTLEHEQISTAFNNVSDPAQLLLCLPPSTQIFASSFAIGSIYLAHKGRKNRPLADIKIETNEYLLLSKSHLYGELHIISEADATFIKRLMQAKTLGEAIPDDDNFDLGTSLAKLIDWQLLTQVSNT